MEIEFRGKRVDNGEWVKGYYFAEWWSKKLEHYIRYELSGDFDEVIPETVGQYTGLKDKNGVKIFTGDIVKLEDYHGERIVEINFHNGVYYYGGDGFSDEYIFNSSNREVLGNKWDNIDLMRVEK